MLKRRMAAEPVVVATEDELREAGRQIRNHGIKWWIAIGLLIAAGIILIIVIRY